MKVPFVLSGANRTSEQLPGFSLQNLYPAMEGDELMSFRPGPCLVQIGGTTQWTDRGSSIIRGLFYFPGAGGSILYAVHGTTLEKITSGASATTVGTVSGTDPVIFDMIRDTVLVCADGKGWYTTGSSLTQISDADFGTVSSIAGLDGRVLASRDASDTFVWSEVFDPGNIGALNFATAEKYGDRLIRVMTHESGLIALFGERSTEIWQPTGDSDTPFARAGGMIYPFGCAARHSCAKHGPIFFFVAVSITDDSPCIGMMSPSFERISDPGMEILLRSLSTTDLAAIRGFAYRQNGATFYQVTLPGVGTYCYHLESRTWLRRRKGTDTVWHSSCYADAYGKHLVGSDSADGKIWEISASTNTDATDTMYRIATAFLPVERPTALSSMLLDGLSSGGSPPQATVEISQDGGTNYRTSRTVQIDKAGVAGSGHRAPLSLAWGAVRRPGALARVTVSGDYRVALYNLLVNEPAT